jgi:hypothetical protein
MTSLITDILERRSPTPHAIPRVTAMDTNVPALMPPPGGFVMSPEDEVLFRYFCVGKPAVWISTKQFNRDVPWCLVISDVLKVLNVVWRISSK